MCRVRVPCHRALAGAGCGLYGGLAGWYTAGLDVGAAVAAAGEGEESGLHSTREKENASGGLEEETVALRVRCATAQRASLVVRPSPISQSPLRAPPSRTTYARRIHLPPHGPSSSVVIPLLLCCDS